jgi:hypothetical protein
LEANGRRRKRFPLTPFHFPPNKFYSNFSLIFILFLFYFFDLNLLLYHGSSLLLTPFLTSPWPISYDRAFDVISSPHIHCRFNLIGDLFFFPWNYGVSYGHVLWASSCASERRASLGVVFRFNIDATSSWWRTRIAKSVRSFWSQFPSSLVLPHFLEFSHLGDFVASRPASSDEPETVCEGCYKTENTSIFTWSSIPSVGHYHWLHGPICRLLPNSKTDYLARTIRCILDFLQLWTIIAA